MSTSEILQHLYSLDTSSPDFLRVLYGLIRHDEEEQYSSSLKGEELARLVDFLDDALGTIPTSDDVFRQCLRKLRAICGSHTTLPSSHVICGDLAKVGESPIAFGGFADVWQGIHGDRGVCIKVLRISLNDDESLKKSFFKEAVVWKRLRHPNVVPFLGVTNKPLQLVSEWMPNGTLTHYVKKNPGADRVALLLDVAEGLSYLHMSHTIHGDLKGPNILVDHNGHACLTDFGLASVVHGINSVLISHLEGCTVRWTAPEILKGAANKITREVDVFSFGMVVIEVFTGEYPFSDLASPSVMFKITSGVRPDRPFEAQELGLADPIWNMTVKCWQQDPARRPTITAVVGLLRECYTLRTANRPLSTLPLSQLTGGANGTTVHVIALPTPTDEESSPIQSSMQHSSHSSFQIHEISTAKAKGAILSPYPLFSEPLSDVPRPDRFSDSATAGHEASALNVIAPDRWMSPVDDETALQRGIKGHHQKQKGRSSTLDAPKPSPSELLRTTSLPTTNDPRLNPPMGTGPNKKKEKRPQKTGKALWQGVAAAIRFMVFAKHKLAEDYGGE